MLLSNNLYVLHLLVELLLDVLLGPSLMTTIWSRMEGTVVEHTLQLVGQHTVYSDWTMLAGGFDLYDMKQKRHAANAFPHTFHPQSRVQKIQAIFQVDQHDVVLIQACKPFDIKWVGKMNLISISKLGKLLVEL